MRDGSGSVTLVWLGRRQIPGIDPGRTLKVWGRISCHEGKRLLYNPRYELMHDPGCLVTAAPPEREFQYVEEFVRYQLSQSLGGLRGMLESAVPFIGFTVAWVASSTALSRPRRRRSARP